MKKLIGRERELSILNSMYESQSSEFVAIYGRRRVGKTFLIRSVFKNISSWRSHSSGRGAQIDLVVDRRDHVINLFEIKFSSGLFNLNKKYASELRNKIDVFKQETRTRKSVFLTMITTWGVNQNIHSIGLIQNDLKMDELFRPQKDL